ncbi:MAG: hypothetical protein WCV70_02095 [Patescibacteria group bacterium]|jgi:hypothetical protein
MFRKNSKISFLFIGAVIFTLGLSISFQSLLADWTAPLANPPTCTSGTAGCSAPINSGSNLVQTMQGALYIANTAPAVSGLIVGQGNVGIGTMDPTEKLQIGNFASVGSAAPDAINLGATYSSTAGANPKMIMYDDTINVLGFGISGSQLDYIVPAGVSHVFYVGGVEQARLNPAGNLIIGNKVGIGLSPAYKLDIQSAAANDRGINVLVNATTGSNFGIVAQAAGAGAAQNIGGYFQGNAAASNYGVYIDGTAYNANTWSLYSNNPAKSYFAGSVGIGTLAPEDKLEVAGNIRTTWGDYKIASRYQDGSQYEMGLSFTAATRLMTIFNRSNDSGGNIIFDWPGSVKGKVGIGTASPNKLLHVYGASGDNAEIDIQSVAGANKHWGVYQDRTTEDLRFWNNTPAGEKNILTLTNEGNVGIGTVAPTRKLTIYDGSGAGIFSSAGTNGGSYYVGTTPVLSVSTDGSNSTASGAYLNNALFVVGRGNGISGPLEQLFRVNLSGNVGIGTANPGQKLTVNGTIESTSGGIKFPDGTTQATAGGSISCPACGGTCWATNLLTQSTGSVACDTCAQTGYYRMCTPSGWRQTETTYCVTPNVACPPPMSTPYLFTLTKNDKYLIENDIMGTYFQKDGMTIKEVEKAYKNNELGRSFLPQDIYRLKLQPKIEDNLISLQIKELEPEESNFDRVQLFRVVHDKDSLAYSDNYDIYVSKLGEIKPFSCLDEKGQSCLEAISQADDKRIRKNPGDYIVLKFKVDDLALKPFLSITSWESNFVPKLITSPLEEGYPASIMLTSYLDKTGQWAKAGQDFHPRAIKSNEFSKVDLSSFIDKNGIITLKLGWTAIHSLDKINLTTSEDEPFKTEELQLTKALNSRDGDVTSKLLKQDYNYAHIIRGGSINLTFKSDELKLDKDQVVDYFFLSQGFYHGLRTYLYPEVDSTDSYVKEVNNYIKELNEYNGKKE